MEVKVYQREEEEVESSAQPHCVRCGKVMEKAEDFGTDAEGTRSQEYCCRCMQGGNLL